MSAGLKLRQDIETLIKEYELELKKPVGSRKITGFQRFFLALKAIQELPIMDHNSFFWLASYHGSSSSEVYAEQRRLARVSLSGPQFCAHGIPEFPAWHRVYISKFEKALQSIDAEVTLPYWNQFSETSKTSGFHNMLSTAQLELADGSFISNPLSGYTLQATVGRYSQGTRTFRNNSRLAKYIATQHASVVKRALEVKDYDTFSNHSNKDSLEGPHDNIHGYTGGFMGNPTIAAFDPIFWLHHCFIDFLFWVWQIKFGQLQALTSDFLFNKLIPFEKTKNVFYSIADTAKIEDFNYIYPEFDLGIVGIESKQGRKLFSSLRSAPLVSKEEGSKRELTIAGIDFARLGGTVIINAYAFPPDGKRFLGTYTVFRSSDDCENCVVRSTVDAVFRMKNVRTEHEGNLEFKIKFEQMNNGGFSFRFKMLPGVRYVKNILGNTFEVSY